jgi:hypothetical protein
LVTFIFVRLFGFGMATVPPVVVETVCGAGAPLHVRNLGLDLGGGEILHRIGRRGSQRLEKSRADQYRDVVNGATHEDGNTLCVEARGKSTAI